MNWKDMQVSDDNTHFVFDGKPIFDKTFIEVLKFHSPGLAPVIDKSGAYHIDTSGNELYSNRYSRTFGFYCNRASVIERQRSRSGFTSTKKAKGFIPLITYGQETTKKIFALFATLTTIIFILT
jgi:hypothetical protein